MALGEWMWLDYLMTTIVTISMMIGVWRGLVREAISLGTWIVATWGSLHWAQGVGEAFAASVTIPQVRFGMGFILCFVGLLVIGWAVRYAFSLVVEQGPLKYMDRLLGLAFGFMRGALMVAVGVFLAGKSDVIHHPDWKRSALVPHFQVIADWMQETLAPQIGAFSSELAST